MIRTDDALGGTTQYRYGPSGLREVIDARGNLISMALDAYGARESITDPDTGHTSFTHNAFGEPTLQIDNAGIQSRFFYDHLGRLERKEVYDPADGTTDTSLWSYGWTGQERGRLRSLIGPDGHRVDYGYNPLGQRASETYGLASGESFRFDYGFDAIGRLQHLTYPEILELSRESGQQSNGVATLPTPSSASAR